MHKPQNINWLIERSKIIEVIVGFAIALDEKNWQKLQGYLLIHLSLMQYYEQTSVFTRIYCSM